MNWPHEFSEWFWEPFQNVQFGNEFATGSLCRPFQLYVPNSNLRICSIQLQFWEWFLKLFWNSELQLNCAPGSSVSVTLSTSVKSSFIAQLIGWEWALCFQHYCALLLLRRGAEIITSNVRLCNKHLSLSLSLSYTLSSLTEWKGYWRKQELGVDQRDNYNSKRETTGDRPIQRLFRQSTLRIHHNSSNPIAAPLPPPTL